MKKILSFLLCMVLVFAVAGCEFFTTPTKSSTTSAVTTDSLTDPTTSSSDITTNPTTAPTTTTSTTESALETIDFYSINDLHGTAYSDLSTFSKMSQYLYSRNIQNENTIILASGDMFQGTAFSNYYYGLPLIESMNAIGFDAFTLGNHEFDWGIDKIANYNDNSEENGEADFPILAANIVSKTTKEPMPWTEPYTIVTVSGIKIGIIGVIGDVINSISASRVADYEFTDVVDSVSEYAYELRTQQDCDIVIVSVHEYESSTNNALANLSGDYRIDAIFNGHTHSNQSETITRTGVDLPYAQVSGSSTSLIAHISLVYDKNQDAVIDFSVNVISSSMLGASNTQVDQIINVFGNDNDYLAFINQELANASSYISKYDSALAIWGASVVRDYAGVDFGMVNQGGFRVNIQAGPITMGELVTVYPFDNYIKTCELTGQQLTYFYSSVLSRGSDVVFDDGVSYSGGVLFKDGSPVDLSAYYTVGAVDYIFDKTNYMFLSGRNIQTTTYLMRNLLADDLLNTVGYFNPSNGTSYNPS